MVRSIGHGLLGVALGAIASYSFLTGFLNRSAIEAPEAVSVSRGSAIGSVEQATFTGSRLAVFESVAAIEASSDMESALDTILRSADSQRRAAEVELLLLRFLEMNPERAIRYAQDRRVSKRHLTAMFLAWTLIDHERAILTLGELENSDLVRSVAIAILDAFPEMYQDIRELSNVLPGVDRVGFVSESLASLAKQYPWEALRETLNLKDVQFRQKTIQRIAAEWVKRDPSSALSALTTISEPRLRHFYHVSAVVEWASIDPTAALEYLIHGKGRELFLIRYNGIDLAVSRLAAYKPYQLLAESQNLTGELAGQLQAAALKSIAAHDITAALQQLEPMPTGAARTNALEMIAASFARQDPSGALEWAERAAQSSPTVIRVVISELSKSDIDSAIDLALEHSAVADMVEGFVSNLDSLASSEIPRIASRLLLVGESQHRAVARIIESWAAMDTKAAADWFLRNRSAVDLSLVQDLAAGAVRRGDVAVVAAIVPDLPTEARGQLIRQIAGGYLMQDADSAVQWLYSLRGDPDLDSWVSDAIEQAVIMRQLRPQVEALIDPTDMARALGTIPNPSEAAASEVASLLASSDARQAAQWALALTNPDARTAAVAAVASVWTRSSPSLAQQWVLSLPGGEIKDRALLELISGKIVSNASIDRVLLRSFSSDAATQNALLSSVDAFVELGRRDPDAAQGLIRTIVEDVEVRRQLEQRIDESRKEARQ